MADKYTQMKKDSAKLGERNDCAVFALALAGRVSYVDAHKALKRWGRRPKGGTHSWMWMKAGPDLGLNMEQQKYKTKDLLKSEIPLQPNGSRYTTKTIGKLLKRGYYLCYSRTHAFAVINGVVHDWSAERRLQVQGVVKVTKGV